MTHASDRNGQVRLAQIRAVAAVADSLNFTRASEAIGVTQPTVSMQVKGFEDLCGTNVFLRDSGALELTAFGHLIVPKIRRALRALDDVQRTIDARDALDVGTILVGFSAHRFFMPILGRYMQEHPRITVRARVGTSSELLEALTELKLDAALVTLPNPDPAFVCELVYPTRVQVYCAADHPLAARKSVRLADLSGVPFVHREPTSTTFQVFQMAMTAGGHELVTRLELASWEAALAAVAQGIGPGIILEDELPDWERVVTVPIVDPELAVGQYLVTLREQRKLAAIDALFATAKAAATPDT